MEINPIIAEIWTLCAIATLLIAARVFCRARLVGVAGFRPDDYLVFLAWVKKMTDITETSANDVRKADVQTGPLHVRVCHGDTFHSRVARSAHVVADTGTTEDNARIGVVRCPKVFEIAAGTPAKLLGQLSMGIWIEELRCWHVYLRIDRVDVEVSQ